MEDGRPHCACRECAHAYLAGGDAMITKVASPGPGSSTAPDVLTPAISAQVGHPTAQCLLAGDRVRALPGCPWAQERRPVFRGALLALPATPPVCPRGAISSRPAAGRVSAGECGRRGAEASGSTVALGPGRKNTALPGTRGAPRPAVAARLATPARPFPAGASQLLRASPSSSAAAVSLGTVSRRRPHPHPHPHPHPRK